MPRPYVILAAVVMLIGGRAFALDAGQNSARGIIRSANEAAIATDLSARVLRLPFREGQRFQKGDLLVAFDCDKIRAELKSAEAEHRGHDITVLNNINLQHYHAVGSNDLTLSKAVADKSAATVEGWKARVAQCEIIAPFDGRVADVLVHEYELPAASTPIIRIVDITHIEVDAIVPSRWLRSLIIGTPFTFSVEETGETIEGKIARIGAAVDPVSQTIRIIGILDHVGANILPGMSGSASFPTLAVLRHGL